LEKIKIKIKIKIVQGRPDPRGRLHCFWHSNKT
jgi:hypothetical protein